MKIGILLSRFPYPLEKGDKLRAYHQIKALSKHHQIYLCALSAHKVKAKELEELHPYCEEIKVIHLGKIGILFNLIISLLFSTLPLQVAYFFNKKAKAKVWKFFQDKQIEQLYCQLIRTAEYVKDFPTVPKTLDYMDALSRGMERRINQANFFFKPLFKIETLRLKKYEHFIFNSFENCTIISEQDRDLIVHAQNQQIQIIRNGVDQAFFKPQEAQLKYDLLFTGNMSYPPNVGGVEFLVKQILPDLWKERPELKLAIAGANPSNRVQRLAGKNVIVTGWVDDIREYYAQSRIFIAPMQIGTGLQNKLLEAMAMQRPCITSKLANNALGGLDGKNILIGEQVEDYQKHISMLLDNEVEAKRLAIAGNEFVSSTYNWASCTKELEALFLNTKAN